MTRKRKGILLLVPVIVLVLVLAVSSVGMAAAGGNGKGNGKGNASGNGKVTSVTEATATTVSGVEGKSNNGKGVIHEIYTAPDGTVYNAIYHVNTGKLTVTGAIYPKSGPLKFCPDCGSLK
jgi:hypothetical protein